MAIGFCENCGSYIAPEKGEVIFIDAGGVIEVCPDCSKTVSVQDADKIEDESPSAIITTCDI